MKPTKMEPAPVDISCVDTWPPFTLSEYAMMAYKALEADGAIRIEKVSISKTTGRTDVRYFAQIPHDWVLQRLKELKNEFTAAGQQIEMEVD